MPHTSSMDMALPTISSSQRVKNKKKAERQAAFAASEAAKAQDDPLINRQDFEDDIYGHISLAYQFCITQMQEWFVEFATDPNIDICRSEDEARKYFSKHGTPLTISVARMFVQYLAESRSGNTPGSNGRLHLRTLHTYLNTLQTALRRSGNPLDPAVTLACRHWIEGKLISQGLVNTKSRVKRLTTAADVTSLLQTVFSVPFMATFRNTREILNLSLFINMAVDCCGRIGELLLRNGPWIDQSKGLRWRHVRVYAFRESGSTILRALVTYENLKGRKVDPSRNKTIPLRLLPLEFVLEDTLRQLLCVALIDDAFLNVRRWDDFEALNPEAGGTLVKFKESALNLPVFRRTVGHTISEDPLLTLYMTRCLKRLGRAAGLEGPLMSYALRRGIAYVLANNVSKEDRCALMGHKDGDGVYWRSYRNTTSTIDFQAVFRQQETQDLSMMSSIYLNTRAKAPTFISVEGYQSVLRESSYVELLEIENQLLDSIVVKHGSVAEAALSDPALHARYRAATKTTIAHKSLLTKKTFKEEYDAFFTSDCGPFADVNHEVPEKDFCDGANKATESDQTELVDAEIDEDSDDNALIDPQLLVESAGRMADFIGEAGNADDSDDVAEEGGKSGEAEGTSTILLLRRQKQKGTHKILIMPVTVVDRLPSIMAGQSTFQTDTEMMAHLTTAFNRLHVIDQFYPGHEPMPGTWICRICNKSFDSLGKEPPQIHVKSCEYNTMADNTLSLLMAEYPILPCTWTSRVGGRSNKSQDKMCGHLCPDAREAHKHLAGHFRYRDKEKGRIRCRFEGCLHAEPAISFHSTRAFHNHIAMVHQISVYSKMEPTEDNPQLRCAYNHLHWCDFCCRWLNTLTVDLCKHAMSHRDIIQEVITSEGYSGCKVAGKVLLPHLCPFCIHNDSMDVCDRFHSSIDEGVLLKHMNSVHIKEAKEKRNLCPASLGGGGLMQPTCSETREMSKTELIAHLSNDHGLHLQRKVRTADDPEAAHPRKLSRKNPRGVRTILEAKPAGAGVHNLLRQAVAPNTDAKSSPGNENAEFQPADNLD